MAEESKKEGETPADGTPPATPEQPAEQPAVTVEGLQAELDKVQKALREANSESAARRKKLEAFEKAEADRKQAELSEVEKIQAQLKEAQERAAKLERENAQRAAAEKTGLPLAFASRIQGETPKEMEADAKTLLEAMPKPQPPDPKKPVIYPTSPGTGAGSGETDEQKRKRLGLR